MPGEDADWPFALHEQVGLVGLGVLMLFWLWTLIRDERETPLQRLFPWFSNEAFAEVVADIEAIVRAVVRRRAPPLHLDALSSAVHGLGLLLATFLAMSGALWFALFTGTPYGRIVLIAAQAGWEPDVGLSDRARVGGAPPPGARRPYLRPHVLGS